MPWPYSRPAYFIQVPEQVVQARFQQIQGSYSRALMIDQLFCLTNYEWSLASTILSFPHGINVPDYFSMSFESILLWCPPGIRIGVLLGRVHWKTIQTMGWALCPSLIRGSYWAFCFPMFLSGLVSLCSWIHSTLSWKQGFAIPTSYIFVLRDTDQTIPLHEYAAHCCQPLLLLCSISGTRLPRSTVSLLLSFTLNQASATTSHSIMPSRRNGKFTWQGFVRGC